MRTIAQSFILGVYYQVFVEPKGDHLLNKAPWKEKFLLQLKKEHRLDQLWKGEEYILWGMPFYNENNKHREFRDAFNEFLVDEENVEYEV